MDRTDEILRLRSKGFTIRDISRITDVPKSSVHKILKSGLPVDSNECSHGNDGQNPMVGQGVEPRPLLVHLPYRYFCPGCGREQNHALLCLDCGLFLPAECGDDCSYYEGFSLSEVMHRT